jgi:thioesterase domain-containing protein/aryl carrier-like protein
VGYVVWRAGTGASTPALRTYLETRLPAVMIPSAWILLEALPLTPNGKLDRRALPAPARQRDEREQPPVSPRDHVEERLVHIWEELLDVRPIGTQDDFFALGGHSLLALRLMIRVHKEFGAAVSLAALIRAPTVEQMARILRGEASASLASPIIALQPRGSRPPFFCVHPGAGDVLCYSRLAFGLGANQPFLGIQDPGMGDARIEDIARRYVSEIVAYQPDGPYYVGGWSFGGVVAFEMAQQLARDGRDVAFLAVLDSGVPGAHGDGDVADDVLLRIIARELSVLFGTNANAQMPEFAPAGAPDPTSFILEALKNVGDLPAETGAALIGRMLSLFRARIVAVRNYSPEVYPGQVTVFKASERSPYEMPTVTDGSGGELVDRSGGWSALSGEPIDIQGIPGDHASMLVEPHVGILAEKLRGCLEMAQARSDLRRDHVQPGR